MPAKDNAAVGRDDRQDTGVQRALVEVKDEEDPTTVHLVLGNYMDDPHPHVEAVYDNADAAERHSKAITESQSINAPTAWGTHEVEIQSGIDGCPICGCEDYHVSEHKSDIIDDKARCEDCPTTWRVSDD